MRFAFLALPLLAAASPRHRYYAMRHGQSIANVEGIISSDPRVATVSHGLSEVGWEQAAEAAEQVAREAEATCCCGVAIVSSDFRRARQTAEAIRAFLITRGGLRVWPSKSCQLDEALRERSFGELNGGSDDRYADVWVEDARDVAHEQFGVESVLCVAARARSVVERIETGDELPPGRWMVVLVAHGDVLQILQADLEGVDPRTHRELEHLPTAKLRLLLG